MFLVTTVFVEILLLALFSLQALAETEAVATCNQCSSGLSWEKQLDQLKRASQQMSEELNCANLGDDDCTLLRWLQAKHRDYGRACEKFFVDENGKIGEFSRSISSLIMEDIKENQERSQFVVGNPDFDKYCPNFNKMSVLQKVAFHSWIFELTAFPESTCNPSVPANRSPKVPNGPAVCLYQLELAPDLRKWRSAGFKQKHCAVSEKEILSLSGCTGCAFDEYKRHLMRNGRPFGILSEDGKQRVNRAYWASHNPLPTPTLECMQKNVTLDKNKKPLWLTACKGAMTEWLAPIKFFGRLPRFILCGTPQAAEELRKLNAAK